MLDDRALERFARQIVLPDVGAAGQARLARAGVAVVGMGGLGAQVALLLAAAGVGRLTLIDHDRVELSNLPRQTLYAEADLGAPKAEAAARRLAERAPATATPVVARLGESDAEPLLAGHDAIADGTDRFTARGHVNRAAVALGIPLSVAALGPWQVQVGRFEGHRADRPCWACFAGTAQDRPGASCADEGILPPVAALGAAAQALDVLRLLLGHEGLAGRLWLMDAWTMATRTVRVPKDPACPVCGAP